ncbi:MAG: hypothetical protein OXH64_03295, partial [Rhodospirillaceae bacterium]|nr:hypothetical protein [Rhodospirillaceae bacterium]
WRFLDALRELSRDSLFLGPIPGGRKGRPVRSRAGFAEHIRTAAPAGELLELTRARCIFEHGVAGIGQRFEQARREVLGAGAARDTLIAELRDAGDGAAEPGLSALEDMRGGVQHVERTARLLQLLLAGDAPDDPALSAASVFRAAAAKGRIADDAAEDLADAATLWRNLRGALRLVADEGGSVEALGSRSRAVLAQSCGRDDFDALRAAIGETAARAAAPIGALDDTADCAPAGNGRAAAPDDPA